MKWLFFQSQSHRPAHVRREVFVEVCVMRLIAFISHMRAQTHTHTHSRQTDRQKQFNYNKQRYPASSKITSGNIPLNSSMYNLKGRITCKINTGYLLNEII